jgi:hypothetical protein
VTLSPGGPPWENDVLRLSARAEALTIDMAQGKYQSEHLILTIQNKTHSHVVYRVDTSPDSGKKKCLGKGDLEHNAIALAPDETIERTECTYRSGAKLLVQRVETLVVPPLSYYFASMVFPAHVGLDERATRGHKAPARAKLCSSEIPQQAIARATEQGTATWRDVMDFYGRHSCDRHTFPEGYRAFANSGERTLPVTRESLARP